MSLLVCHKTRDVDVIQFEERDIGRGIGDADGRLHGEGVEEAGEKPREVGEWKIQVGHVIFVLGRSVSSNQMNNPSRTRDFCAWAICIIKLNG